MKPYISHDLGINRMEKIAERMRLVEERTKLMAIVDAEKQYNNSYGIKHLSASARKVLDAVWTIDEKIMELT
jgi:hypothetical protein